MNLDTQEMNLDIKCFAITILILKCSFAQEPNKKRCVGGYELSFFYSKNIKKSNSAAIQACKNYRNSRLVKVDNHNISSVINSVIGTKSNASYIDGKADSGRNWKWSDGSKIYLRSETEGYQNWYEDQPNNLGGKEDCIIVRRGTTKWKDSRCDELLGYICQRDLDPCITVTSPTPNIHKCVATGSTAPQVEWRRNDIPVAAVPYQTIYQTRGFKKATLYSENATIGDAGIYVCAAWIGANDTEKLSEPVKIKVNGKPSIIDVTSFKCNSSLLVSWKPNQSALGFLHKMKACEPEYTFKLFVTPIEQAEILTEVTGFQPDTNCRIQVSACVKQDTCAINNRIFKTAVTNGKAKRVTNVSLTQLNESNICTVLWNWPYERSKNETANFAVELHSDSGEMPETKEISLEKTKHGRYSYSFEPRENHSYSVNVQSVKSVNSCNMVSAVGSCIAFDIYSDTAKQNPTTTAVAVSITFGILLVIGIAVLLLFWQRKKSKRTKAATINNNALPDDAIVDTVYENCTSPEYCNIPEYENVGSSAVRHDDAQNFTDTVYENFDQRITPSSIYEN